MSTVLGKFHVEMVDFANERETIFVLDGFKQGCNRILFGPTERRDLRALLLAAFENDRPFDFDIDQVLPRGTCTIKSIKRFRGP